MEREETPIYTRIMVAIAAIVTHLNKKRKHQSIWVQSTTLRSKSSDLLGEKCCTILLMELAEIAISSLIRGDFHLP